MIDERSFEKFFLDNDEFEELASSLDVFCPFEAIGMIRQEIRHSFFLRYILDPLRPHGFGAECLRGFIHAAANSACDSSTIPIRPLDVHLMNLDSAVVDREYQHIDLLIRVPNAHVVIAVELKIDSTESRYQLSRYREIVEREFPIEEGWKHIFLFLTKKGDAPSEGSGKGWLTLPLEVVVEMFERVLMQGNGHPNAKIMLEAYLCMLRRHHLTDQRLEELAQKLWSEHHEVLDYLMKRRPSDIASKVLSYIFEKREEAAEEMSNKSGLNVVVENSTKNYIRFGIEDWDEMPGMLTGKSPNPSDRIMFFEIFGNISCKFNLGPGDVEARRKFFESLKSCEADVGGKGELKKAWRKLASANLVDPDEGENVDEIYREVIEAASKFLTDHKQAYSRAVDSLKISL